MLNKKFILALAVFCVFAFLPASLVRAQYVESPKITSATENSFSGKGISVKGTSLPGLQITANIKDDKDNLIYSIKTNVDNNGNWSAVFDQPLESGAYYVVATAQDSNGSESSPAMAGPINIKGPFALIIGIFSALVIILLFGFVGGWYFSKWEENKRYRRILMSQRDAIASYNVIKKDAERALKNLYSKDFSEGRVNEMEFFLKRINDNLEKMNKYVVAGIKIISKYDIMNKIYKTNKKI